MTYPTFTGAPVFIPAWRRPFVAWRTRQANAARDRAIAAAIEAMDGLGPLEQFEMCWTRLMQMADGGVVEPHTMEWAADGLRRAAWRQARRG